MFTRILLTCAIGENLDGVEVDYWENGKCVKKDVPYALRQSFSNCIDRMTHAHNILFPSLINHHFLPYDRDTYLSAKALRALFQKMVDNKRALQKSDP
jgi:hypothetical protein